MKVILSGGGTLGSVSPLLAIFELLKKQRPDAQFLWVATRRGPEHTLLEQYGITIRPIFAGKLRRYFSVRNLADPFLVIVGFFQSLLILLQFKPDVILSAGGFVSVPLVWAGWLLKVPSLIHQQDVRAGLANKLMAPYAKIITVTFAKSKADFPSAKTVVTGNPVRPEVLQANRQDAFQHFELNPSVPTIFVIGGGTGAFALNELVAASINDLVAFCQVIHLTGDKAQEKIVHPRYRQYDFLTGDLPLAYAAADLVVARAGMSTLTELAALGKPAILIPIPGSHQEDNVVEFVSHNAALLVEQQNLNATGFVEAIRELLGDKAQLANLSRNITSVLPKDAAERIVTIIV